MKHAFHLDLVTNLPVIRKAFDNKTLQMFQGEESATCQYSGPCAIGVCAPVGVRHAMDDYEDDVYSSNGDTTIARLLDAGFVTTDHREEVVKLQELHDNAVGWSGRCHDAAIGEFERFLRELEEMYL